MTEIQTISILNAIKEYPSFHSGIFFTYGVDLAFFENAFLHPLWQNNCRNNLIYIDSERYADTTSDWRDSASQVGRRYVLIPIRYRGQYSFHSKLILLLGVERARLLLGSGNLTFTGIGANYEVFTCLDWTEGNNEHLHIFKEVWQLIEKIQDPLGHSDQARKMLEKAGYRSEWLSDASETSNKIQFLHNLDEPLIDQCSQTLAGENIQEITIVTPFLDDKAHALEEIYSRFKPQKIKLVVQNQKSVGNLKALERLQRSGIPLDVHLFDDEHYLHAKIYLFKAKKSVYLLTGSANCTGAAWLYKAGQGNFETMLLSKADARNHFEYLLKDKINPIPIPSLDQLRLAESRSLPSRSTYPIELLNVSLFANVLTINFIQSTDKTIPLGLEISTIPTIRLPLDSFVDGEHQFKITLSDKQFGQIQHQPLIVYIVQLDRNGAASRRVSNEIWITNSNELNRIRQTLSDIDFRTGELLGRGLLGSEEEWRDLYQTISQLVNLEVEQVQRTSIRTYTIKNSEKKLDQEETETKITFPDDYEIGNQRAELEGAIFRESTFYAWLECVNRTLPWRHLSTGVSKAIATDQLVVRKQPSENLQRKFTDLVSRYIRALVNAEYMQSISTYHAIYYFTTFHEIVWLLYNHHGLEQSRFLIYSEQINSGLFDTHEYGAPILNPGTQKHIRRIWEQEWYDSGAALHALVSIIVSNKYRETNYADTDYPLQELSAAVLANIAVVVNFEKLLNDNDGISKLASVYQLDSAELLVQLENFIHQWQRRAASVLETWLQKVTFAIGNINDQLPIKWLYQARVDYGLALEQIYIRLGENDAITNLTSDLIFWAERAGDERVVHDQRSKLMKFFQKRGNLTELARQLIDSGTDSRNNGLYSDANRQFKQALILAEQTGEERLIRLCNIYLEAMHFYVN
jgi:hypothetical protein